MKIKELLTVSDDSNMYTLINYDIDNYNYDMTHQELLESDFLESEIVRFSADREGYIIIHTK